MNSTESAAEKVYLYIKELILRGALCSGARIPSERELQDALGVSRVAVREGVSRLGALGIITRSKGRVSVVNTAIDITSLSDTMLPLFSTRDEKVINDLIRTRIILEKETAASAASCRTEEDIRRLEAVLTEMKESLQNAGAFAESDYRFHLELARIGGNIVLQSILAALHDQIRLFIDHSIRHPSQREEALQFHGNILESIRIGDGERTKALMHLHIADCKMAYDAENGKPKVHPQDA